MSEPSTPRWELRFKNFLAAKANLADAVETYRQRPLTVLEQAGLIQLFEITWDVAWKVIRDYLTVRGVTDEIRTPVGAIRAAYAADLIADGQRWMDATKLRHTLSHAYHPERAAEGQRLIAREYLAMFDALAEKLANEVQRSRPT